MIIRQDVIDLINLINSSTSAFFDDGIINFMISTMTVFLISYIIYKIIKKMIIRKNMTNANLAVNIIKAVIMLLAIYQVLTMFKPLKGMMSTILASGGIVALGISLSAQDVLSNLISGIMIAMTHPFVEGDTIHINNKEYNGIVEEITLRHTIIRTIENTRITIPNSIMNSATIENNNLVDERQTNYLYIEIGYDSDMDKAISIIKEEAIKNPLCIDMRKNEEEEIVKVLVTDFLASSIQLRAAVNTKNAAEGFQLLSDLRYAIKKRFDQEGIEIPYQYTNIIMQKDEKES